MLPVDFVPEIGRLLVDKTGLGIWVPVMLGVERPVRRLMGDVDGVLQAWATSQGNSLTGEAPGRSAPRVGEGTSDLDASP